MQRETTGTVIKISKQWWLKINTKSIRFKINDGAIYPYIIKVKYSVNDNTYFIRKWLKAGSVIPNIGDIVKVVYFENKPSKGKII